MFIPENTKVLNPEMCFSSFVSQERPEASLQCSYDPLKMLKIRENEGREKSKISIKLTLLAEVRRSLKFGMLVVPKGKPEFPMSLEFIEYL